MILKYLQVGEDGRTEFRVSLGCVEDLWHLHNLITVDDIVRGKTTRKLIKENAAGDRTSADKVTITMEIRVDKIEFDPIGELRLGGKNLSNIEGIRLNASHTLMIRAEPQDLVIRKVEWNPVWEERLRDACDAEGKADTGAICMDYGKAYVCLLNQSMIITKSIIEVNIAKKHKTGGGSKRDESIQRFFKQTMQAVLSSYDFNTVKVVVVCSPGTLQSEFVAFVKRAAQEDTPDMKTMLANLNKFMQIKTYTGSRGAITEILKDQAVQKLTSLSKGLEGVNAWEEFEKKMAKQPDYCTYTPQLVLSAFQNEAVDTLLISDTLLRVPIVLHRRFYVTLTQAAKMSGIKVFTLSSEENSGRHLDQISGIAAILRFPLPDLDDVEVEENFIDSSDVVRSFLEEHTTSSGMGSPSQSTVSANGKAL